MRRRTRLTLLAGLGLALAATAPAVAKGKPGGGGGGSTAFRPGVLLQTSGLPYGLTQAEPSIRVDSLGRMYVAAPAANGVGCELWTVSTDLTSQRFTPSPDLGIGGGDCDLAVSATIPH